MTPDDIDLGLARLGEAYGDLDVSPIVEHLRIRLRRLDDSQCEQNHIDTTADFDSQLGALDVAERTASAPSLAGGRPSTESARIEAFLDGGGGREPAGLNSGLLVQHQLSFTAAHAPDRVALLVRDGMYTFGDLAARSGALAVWLQRSGITRGDRVAIVADNCVELVVALWAVLRAGGVFVVVNPTTKADKLAYILDDCGVRAVVAQGRLARTVLPALDGAPSVSTAVWVGGVPRRLGPRDGEADHEEGDRDGGGGRGIGHVGYDEVLATTGEPDDPGLIDADLAGLIYTSGSTGQPKGVMLTHRNLVHNTWSISTYLGLQEDDVVACLLPLSFDYGLFQIFMAARVGCTVALEKSFAYPRDTLERLAETRTTVLPGVPTIFATLLQMAPFDDLDMSSVRMLTNTAAALPPAHIERLRKTFPGAEVFCMYGLTECTRVSYLDPARLDEKMGSVGKAMPNTETYIVDEHGERAGPGEEGELVVRGASVMRGYWGKPEATAACLRDGEIEGEKVLHTGDRFWADDDGFLYFVGRRDDVFKCKGEKISPKEIEHVLYELEDVAEAAVVGVPDDIDGSAVKAVVAVRSGAELTEELIRRHCRARLENYMVPKFVEVRDSLPKTDSGKIRKAALVPEPQQENADPRNRAPQLRTQGNEIARTRAVPSRTAGSDLPIAEPSDFAWRRRLVGAGARSVR